jgi:hypothetical protein
MDSCRVGETRVGGGIHSHRGGDAAWRGEVNGAPTAAAMKGPQWLCRRGPSTGAAAVKGSRHGGGSDDDDVPAATACAPVASLAVQRWSVRGK